MSTTGTNHRQESRSKGLLSVIGPGLLTVTMKVITHLIDHWIDKH